MLGGSWKPGSSVPMVRRLQGVLVAVRPRRGVFFAHGKSHHDDGVCLHDIIDTAVLGNVRADELVD
jgi:hypothetical protein